MPCEVSASHRSPAHRMSLTSSVLARQSTPAASPMPSRLERSRALIESRFLQAGEVLGLAVQGVGQLIGSLDRMSGALDARSVAATTGELETCAQTLLEVP